MKKIVLTLIVLLFATPAWAVVNITATQVGESNEVIISWETVNEPNLVRAFGLDIRLDNDANILSVTGLSPDYKIYPGTIQIDVDGQITYDGTIAAEYSDLPSDTLEGPPDGNGVTLEAASLYAPVGPGSPNAPPASGDLASLIISKSCTLCITANVSRAGTDGVVMEDPDQPVTVNYPAVCLDVNIPEIPIDCYIGQVDYDQFEVVGKPTCWCYARQCRGDADGLTEGNLKAGFWYVGLNDLNIMVSGWKVLEPAVAPTPSGPGITSVEGAACADFDHLEEGNLKAGFWRVGLNDLNIMVAHWKILEPAVAPTPSGPGIPGDCAPGSETP